MIAVVQRVSRAEVRIDGREPAGIGRGLLVLVGVARGDTEADATWLARKCLSLRIFSDGEGRMNLGLEEVGGGILTISQFTLLGDCVKGRRPSWSEAAEPAEAERLYEHFVAELRRAPHPVATGVFQAMMQVESVNEGPVTLILDSHRWKGRPGGGGVEAAMSSCAGEAGPEAPREGAPAGKAGTGVRARGGEAAAGGGKASGEALDGTLLLMGGEEPLILASRSPRRAQLLAMLGVRFQVTVPLGGEDGCRRPGESPAAYVTRQAEAKALAAAAEIDQGIVLAADTIVHLDGRILEKPGDVREAVQFLRRLSGREHEVFTGLCLARAGGRPRWSAVERTEVRVSELDDETIERYVASGEPLDKAGAYGIQGLGGMFIAGIRGCYFNVMGLPLARLRALFGEMRAAAERGEAGRRVAEGEPQ